MISKELWEEYRQIAAKFPEFKVILARQPEPAYRAPPESPLFVIIDYPGLLKGNP